MTWKVLDIECDGDPFTGKLLLVGWGDEAFIPPQKDDGGEHDFRWLYLLASLADPSITKVTFTKYDHRWLKLAGYEVEGPIHDVQTMAWVLDETSQLDLEYCARRYAHVEMDKRLRQVGGRVLFRADDGSETEIADAPPDQLAAYNERDLEATSTLYKALRALLSDAGQLGYWEDQVQPMTEVLVDMECRGLPIDMKATGELEGTLIYQSAALLKDLRREFQVPEHFNFGSTKQLQELLFTQEFDLPARVPISKDERDVLKAGGRLGTLPNLFVTDKVGTQYASGHYALDGLNLTPQVKAPKCDVGECAHEDGDHLPSISTKTLQVHHGRDMRIQTLLERRKIEKIIQFLESWTEKEQGGRLYGRFNQTGTKTGRLSSSEPNLQQVPARGVLGRQVRGLFVPSPKHVFIHGDYGQLEPRLMAHFSQDPVLVETFKTGKDLYLEMAERVLGKPEARDLMKVYVLALGYGAKARKLTATLAESGYHYSLREVQKTLTGIEELLSVFFEWKEATVDEAYSKGYVETIGGHRRHIAMGGEQAWKKERQAVNAVIQGSAANIVEHAMIKLPDGLILQVHDELLWEVPDGVPRIELGMIQRVAENPPWELTVPLVFEPKVVTSWAGGKS